MLYGIKAVDLLYSTDFENSEIVSPALLGRFGVDRLEPATLEPNKASVAVLLPGASRSPRAHRSPTSSPKWNLT